MTVALVANIARPISSALSQAFAMDNVGKLSAYGVLGSPDAAIMALFANNEIGAFYDPSDLSAMFQDSAGTTPVTADGQPVGKILDKSGRGNHASQATAASRPLYKTDGTYHWLQFDGVDDSLSTASIDFSGTDKMSVFCGVQKIYNLTINYLTGLGNAQNGLFDIYLQNSADLELQLGSSIGTDYGYGVFLAPVLSRNVFTSLFDNNKPAYVDRYKARQNTVELTPTDGYSDGSVGNFENAVLTVGATAPPDITFFFEGSLYSLIVRGAMSTADEITDTETWVNSKTGAF